MTGQLGKAMDDLSEALRATDELATAAREATTGQQPSGVITREVMDQLTLPTGWATCETCGVAVFSLRKHMEWHAGLDKEELTLAERETVFQLFSAVLVKHLGPNYEIRSQDYVATARALVDALG